MAKRFTIFQTIILTISLLTNLANANSDKQIPQKPNNEASVKEIYFDNSDQIARRYSYSDGALSEIQFFSKAGALGTWQKWYPTGLNRWIKETLFTTGEQVGHIKKRVEVLCLDGNVENSAHSNFETLKEWYYLEGNTTQARYADIYENNDTTRPVAREIYNESGALESSIRFYYRGDETKAFKFVEETADGTVKQHSLDDPFDPEKTWRESQLSQTQIQTRRNHLQSADRLTIAIIDSGFDYNHLELAHQWWLNPLDPLDGLDNDGNGWVDDTIGWDQAEAVGLPAESTTNLTDHWRPFSHGTHVAHIASRDLLGAGLIGFAGNYTQATYVDRISEFLQKHQVKIVNMSFGLPSDFRNVMGLKNAIAAYKRMVKNNPDTLFVVSAGNASKDLDDYGNRQYPASIDAANVIKVGALDTSGSKVKMAKFSNYGVESVDLLAPGVKIEAAALGGGLITHSGTSMATPFVVNVAARLWMEFPELHATEVKEILNNSATVLTPRVPVRSGGYVNLQAAKKLAEKKQTQP